MKLVNMNLEVRIYPSKRDKNDFGEKIVNFTKIDSNIGHARFIWNKELEFINKFKNLLLAHGYDDHVIINDASCNVLLNMLKSDNEFLGESESSSRQQVQRDLITAFERYENNDLNSRYPRFKTLKNPKNSFRIINNNNNVRIQKDKNGYDKIRLAKLGIIKFKTSKKYKQLLQKGTDKNDPTVKIKHVTIKKVYDKYYAVFNIECIHIPEKIIGPQQQVGIDIGCSKLAVFSNKQVIANLDLEKETRMIIRYQKRMSHHKKGSVRYLEAQRLYRKWMTRLVNKRNDFYDWATKRIVENCSFIAVQNENIIFWKKNKHLSRKLQLNAPRIFMDKLEYKSQWNDVVFVKVPKRFPSTQICNKCGEQNKNIKGLKKLKIRNWRCPNCGAQHDRDINASINILKKGLQLIVGTPVQ